MSTAIFKEGKFVSFSSDEIANLREKALASKTGRFRLCLHQNHQDKIQEMVIGITSTSYCRPHSHPLGRSESYSIIEGRILVLFFSKEGNVTEKVLLENNGLRILRINSSLIHMPIAISDVAIYHETLTGPFEKEEMVYYANWAPEEDFSESAIDFHQKMKRENE